jgi:ankyrin repeat protein
LPSSNVSEAEKGRKRSNNKKASARRQATWDSLKSPNLQLNATPERVSGTGRRVELLSAVIASLTLQIGLLVIAGTTATLVSKYEPKPWGLPCYLTGSILLVMGMLSCSVAIERSTEEYTWQLSEHLSRDSNQFRLFWIQRTQRVSDQDFGSHVIFGGDRSCIVTSSRLEDVHSEKSISTSKQRAKKTQTTTSKEHSATDSSETQQGTDNKRKDVPWWLHCLPLVAVVAGGSGFTVQFIGLRGLPWPCAVSQLIGIMIMALIRALIRRRLGRDMVHCKAAKNYELDYLAIQLVSRQCGIFDNNEKQSDLSNANSETPKRPLGKKWLQVTGDNSHSKGQSSGDNQAPEKVFVWKVETAEVTNTGTYIFPYSRPRVPRDTDTTEAQRVVLVRKRLGDLCKWTTSASKPALALARSIERFLDEFLPNGLPVTKNGAEIPLPDISKSSARDKRIEWRIPFSCSDTGAKTEVKLLLTRNSSQNGRWRVDLAGIEAVLSLWMANLESGNSLHDKDLETADWRRAGVDSNVDYCRVLGEKRGEVLKRDISWWVNNPEIYTEKEIQEGEGPDPKDPIVADPAAKDHQDNEIKITIGFIGSSTGLGPTEPTKASDLLFQYSNADLATLTAQHLFTSFMWTIGESIPRQAFHQGTRDIGEHVKVQSSNMFDLHSNVGKLSGRKLNNVNLTRFVTYAEKQGLGTADEILLCIIPTFSFYDRLPNDAVLTCDQPEIKFPGSSRSKDQICARYSYFLDWIHEKKGASLEEYISIAGVARTVEFIYLVALDLANREASDSFENKPDSKPGDGESIPNTDLERPGSRKNKTSKELTKLLELLSGPFLNILKKLFPFYELQRRKKTIVDFFSICLGISNETSWSDQVPSDDFMGQIGFTNLHRKVTNAGDGGFALVNILGMKPPNNRKADYESNGIPVKKGMARDIFGWTPFHYAAARAGLQFSDSNEDDNDASGETTHILQRLKRFLEANPPTGWWLDNFNRSPVHIAAFSGNNGLLKELLYSLPSRDVESVMTMGGRDGMKPLHLAAGHQKDACVTTLLGGLRSDIEIKVDVWKQSPLHTALVNHNYDCAQKLSRCKEFNFSPETPDVFSRPLFFYLLGEGPKKKSLGAEILLTHWNKFEAQHGDKQSVLHLAISFLDSMQLFDLIIELRRREAKQSDVDLMNKYGETPLHLAVRDKKSSLVDLFVDMGASPSAKNNNQLSPMMLACDIGDLSLVRTMCRAPKYLGSEIDGQGRTALHHATLNTKWSVDDCAQAVKLLAGVMVNVDALDQDQCSPLHYAAGTCNGVAFSSLLELKANIGLTDRSGRNVLHHAVLSVETNPDRPTKSLIDSICKQISKTAIDARDDNGQTPLHLAIISDNDETAFFLLSKDANPQIENVLRMTPFMTACQLSSCQKFIKYAVEQSNMLKSNVNKNQPITQDGSNNSAYRDGTEVKSTKADVNPHFKGFDINKVDSSRNLSALGWACCGGSVEVVEILLLAKTVSLKIQATGFFGFTPLHLALSHDSQDMVQRLVADPRVISSLVLADDTGLSPIEYDIRHSNEGCLRPLLEHPNVGPERFSSSQLEDIMDKHRETESQTLASHEWVMRVEAGKDISFPFHKLAKTGQRKEVEELLQFYMNAFELDEDRWTPADVAQWYGHVDLMHYLRDKESKGNFIRPPYRWPSTFFDLYENSTLETTTCPSLNSSPRHKLGQKQRFIRDLH